MRINILHIRLLSAFLCMFVGEVLFGQNEQVIIENANNQVIETKSDPVIQYLNGDVRAYHQGSYIFCDTAVLKGNELYAIGNVSILQDDTVRIFADTLIYLGDSSLALFKKDVILENGQDQLFTSYLEYHLDTKLAYYFNKSIMVNGLDTIKSKRGRYNASIKEAWFYENVSVDGEDFLLRSDSLRFLTEQRHAFWNSPCIIHKDSTRIYSEKGQYNLTTKFGEFAVNAQYISNDTISYADQIIYDGEKQFIRLNGNAHYSTPTDYAIADTITSDLENDVTELRGNALFLSDSLVAEGEKLRFDQRNDLLTMEGRSKYADGPLSIEAEDLKFNRKSDEGIAVGDVVWVDTSAHTTIYCDSLEYRGIDSYFKAIGFDEKPVFANEVDEDTMWLSADTLFSYSQIIYKDSMSFDTTSIDSIMSNLLVYDSVLQLIIEVDSVIGYFAIMAIDTFYQDSIPVDTVQFLVGDNHVKVFKNDMQVIADSLIYNDRDSVFSFFDDPVMWMDTTQLMGDTIMLFLVNEEINSLKMINNAMVVNSTDLYFYNQIGGKIIDGFFKDKQLDEMKVNGNAQSVYYMQDEIGGYIGVNATDCSFIVFNFENKKISDIRFYPESTSKIHPIDGTDHESIKLAKFKWMFDLKPKGYDDIRIWEYDPIIISPTVEVVDSVYMDSVQYDSLKIEMSETDDTINEDILKIEAVKQVEKLVEPRQPVVGIKE